MRAAVAAAATALVLGGCVSPDLAEQYAADLAAATVGDKVDPETLSEVGTMICDDHDVASESDIVTHAEVREDGLHLLDRHGVSDPELVYLLSIGSLCIEHWPESRTLEQVRRDAELSGQRRR